MATLRSAAGRGAHRRASGVRGRTRGSGARGDRSRRAFGGPAHRPRVRAGGRGRRIRADVRRAPAARSLSVARPRRSRDRERTAVARDRLPQPARRRRDRDAGAARRRRAARARARCRRDDPRRRAVRHVRPGLDRDRRLGPAAVVAGARIPAVRVGPGDPRGGAARADLDLDDRVRRLRGDRASRSRWRSARRGSSATSGSWWRSSSPRRWAIVVVLLKDEGRLATPMGQLTLLGASLGDFASVGLLSVLFSERDSPPELRVLLLVLFGVAVFALAAAARHMSVLQRLRGALSRRAYGSSRILIRASFALMVGFAALAERGRAGGDPRSLRGGCRGVGGVRSRRRQRRARGGRCAVARSRRRAGAAGDDRLRADGAAVLRHRRPALRPRRARRKRGGAGTRAAGAHRDDRDARAAGAVVHPACWTGARCSPRAC